MARSKKKPGYNPKQAARDAISANMRSINTVEEMFRQESEILCERIDDEMKSVSLLQHEDLKTYLTAALNLTRSGYLGLMVEFRDKLALIRTPANDTAVEMMDKLAVEKWDHLRMAYSLVDIELSAASTDAVYLGQESLAASIEIFSQFAQRMNAVKKGMKNNVPVADILASMRAMDAADVDYKADDKAYTDPTATVEEDANV